MWWERRALGVPRAAGLHLYVLWGVLLWTKSFAVAWAKPWASTLGRQSEAEGSPDLTAPRTEPPTAFWGRAAPSSTHTGTGQHPHFLQML